VPAALVVSSMFSLARFPESSFDVSASCCKRRRMQQLRAKTLIKYFMSSQTLLQTMKQITGCICKSSQGQVDTAGLKFCAKF